MVSWLVCSTLERVVRVWALAGDIVLCSRARHFTLTVPLSTQGYKLVPANLMLGVTVWWTSIQFQRGSRNTPSRFMLQKPGLTPAWWATTGSYADFIYLTYYSQARGHKAFLDVEDYYEVLWFCNTFLNSYNSYEVTSTKYSRDIYKELLVSLVASLFMGFGVLFLLLWVGIYV